ncbi:hypothetical protein [Pseudomonas aeruginosa]|uniref:hypothetical protein n=1 Tax=Pseudomonas aeruginosa TaxID=287 RepID=UPI001AAF9827|nr:hypothetical protein [Pseudomonas aeruginosa]MBO2857306.1 hypothetical protein [Pseudomonas aeruginosa]MBO2936689.1 hypothetical protein [Pseudomonas aeruginosa]MBO8395505.1 hypothetical protein [Pseudomonas aeruginosa]MCO2630802.1 hypothetical protein [Pseudomonas aeruginosa]MCO2660646.1 hypothetical protein [Pseudomonas aeruginosa]
MSTRIPGLIADAVEAVSYGREHARWLAALAIATRLDLKHNEGREAMELASLAHYLAGDCHNYLDCEVERLRKEIDGAEAVQ